MIYSKYAFGKFNAFYLILLIVAMILIQSATNMINDYSDFKRGADNKKSGSEKALISGEISPKQVLFTIFLYGIIAFIIGIFIASQTSYYIMLVAIIGGIISSSYASGPFLISYTPIGEIVAGVTMGIGITTTVIYIHSGIFNLNTVLVAITTALFIGTILLSNNLSDLEEDREVCRKTLPTIIGIKNAEKLWIFNVVMLLVLTFDLVLIHIYSIAVLVSVICGGGTNSNGSQDDSHEGHNGGGCCGGGSNEQTSHKDHKEHSSDHIDSVDTSKDPVCGINVSKKDAISREINGHIYYFRSDSCVKKFEKQQNKMIK